MTAQSRLSVPGVTVGFPQQEGPAMPTTTTNPHPDVPLPAGAVADPDAWEFWDNEFRIFQAPDGVILDATGRKIGEVRTLGIQFPDGSVDTDENPPSIDVCTYTDAGLTAEQARALAALLVEAADQIDGWAGR
jgi:hypothetical protein